MKLAIVTPAGAASRKGNRITALRWAHLLRELGHHVVLRKALSGDDVHLLVALHARKSHAEIVRFRSRHPDRPIIVVMTGTDLYEALPHDADVLGSLACASRIVVLQPAGVAALPEAMRAKARVVVQSASAPPGPVEPAPERFDVLVLGHLRAVKEPLLAARAARTLRNDSRIRVVHGGAALDPASAAAARREQAENPRYLWLGELRRQAALERLMRARLLILTSRSEGGANVVSEAISCGVPVLSTRIAGSIGLLGTDHPGYFPVGDEAALAALLDRCERDPPFLATLRARSFALQPLVYPARERRALRQLLSELAPPSGASVTVPIPVAPTPAARDAFAEDVRAGLTAAPRQLHCRYFYDDEGSLLFEAICDQPEYDLFRRERRLLRAHAPSLAERFPRGAEVFEFGSGNAVKSRLVLAPLVARGPVSYRPIDISPSAIEESTRALRELLPSLTVQAITGEYEAGFEALARPAEAPRLVLWLGSNIGNLDRLAAAAFLRRIGAHLGPADRLVLGIDGRRPPAALERAYDDRAGVTARFNLNLLDRINRELGGTFDLRAFRHRAAWNEAEGRVDMYLVSLADQQVHIAALRQSFAFRAGEAIHTESSYKYTPDEISALIGRSGLTTDTTFSDGIFSVLVLGGPG